MKPCRNGLPPTGPISPAQKKPASGSSPSSSAAARASWSGAREEVRAAAVAGERAARRRPARRSARTKVLAQVGVGGGRVADVEAQRLADAHRLADAPARRSPRRRRRARASGSRRAGSRRGSRRSRGRRATPPRAALRSCSGVSVPRSPFRRSSAGSPASSKTTLSSASVITESRPTGSQPCETTVRTGTPRSDGADRAVVEHLAVAEERLRVGLAAARRETADERHGVLLLVQLREEAGRRVGERVDEQRDEVGVVEIRDPGHRDAFVGVEGDALEGLDHGVRQRRRPDGRGRAVLELAVARDHALGHAAEHVRGRQLLLDGRERLLGARRSGRPRGTGRRGRPARRRAPRGLRAQPHRQLPPPRVRRTTPPRPGA